MTAAAHEPADASILAATEALLRARGEQRSAPRFGDDADERVIAALHALTDEPAHTSAARQAGARIGRDIFARRVFEDSMQGCLVVLSANAAQAGLGAFHLDAHFHRTAQVRFEPAPRLAGAPVGPVREFVIGILEGTFGEAFNCRAQVKALGAHRFEIALLEGRDVNRRSAP